MLIVVLLFVPVVLAYQIYAYKLFSVKVTDDDLAHERCTDRQPCFWRIDRGACPVDALDA
jgi:hypothetical protein